MVIKLYAMAMSFCLSVASRWQGLTMSVIRPHSLDQRVAEGIGIAGFNVPLNTFECDNLTGYMTQPTVSQH